MPKNKFLKLIILAVLFFFIQPSPVFATPPLPYCRNGQNIIISYDFTNHLYPTQPGDIPGACPSIKPTATPTPTPTPSPTPKPAAPSCSFNGPSQLNIGETGTFSSTSSGNVTSKIWTASGGTPLSGIAHTFNWKSSSSGTYSITLTLFGPGGESACTADVKVPAPTAPPTAVPTKTPTPSPKTTAVPTKTPTPSPTAKTQSIPTATPQSSPILSCSFSVSPSSGTYSTGQTLTFTSTSTSSSGSILSTVWQASGGSPLSGIASSFQWSATSTGTYTINLTVNNAKGSSACNTKIDIVELATPTPSPSTDVSDSSASFVPIVPSGGPVTGKGPLSSTLLDTLLNL